MVSFSWKQEAMQSHQANWLHRFSQNAKLDMGTINTHCFLHICLVYTESKKADGLAALNLHPLHNLLSLSPFEGRLVESPYLPVNSKNHEKGFLIYSLSHDILKHYSTLFI